MSKAETWRQPEAQAYPPAAKTLAGRMAVVTGASSGIGRAIAERLAALGASLCLLGRRPEALQQIAPCLDDGARKLIYQIDLAADGAIESLPDRLARDGIETDFLVHSAGVISLGALEHASIGAFDRQIDVNVRAPYRLTQALLSQLKSRHGQIVFINSMAGVSAVPGSSQYSATKHALRALADSLRAEVYGQVRVTSVFTGNTATPMQAWLHAAKRRAYVPENLIQPEDIASVVCHVLSLPATVELTAIHMRPAMPPD